jgi:hypothetical protein
MQYPPHDKKWGGCINLLIDYLQFYVPLKNFSLTIAGEGLQNIGLCSALRAFEQEGYLSCHTCCDTGPRFFRSHPKDRPIQSSLTTHEGMWKIYSNPDPHGAGCIYERNKTTTYQKD